MEFRWAEYSYSTKLIQDNQAGYAGFELYRMRDCEALRVATLIFWDATGQYFLETFGTDLPLEVINKVVAEARAKIYDERPGRQA